jgi:hypothetical protein
MRIKALFLLLLLLFTSCSTLKLNINQDKIELLKDHNTTIIAGTGQILYKNSIKLNNINIYQTVYKMDNSQYILSVEELYADSGYRFDGAIQKTVSIGFESYSYTKVYSRGNISFFYLTDKQNRDRKLYLITQNQNKKRIQFVYCTNEKLFYEIVEAVKSNTTVQSTNISQQELPDSSMEPRSYIQTTWNQKNTILDGLVYKLGGRVKRPLK